jgi:hypothetical protein
LRLGTYNNLIGYQNTANMDTQEYDDKSNYKNIKDTREYDNTRNCKTLRIHEQRVGNATTATYSLEMAG